MRNKLILVFIALILSEICSSNDYRFAHLTAANGISQSEVYTFLEDRNGFMWIGTLDGLNRYDGYSFEIFNTDRTISNSLSNNTIRSLAEDQYGRIWIGTDNGLNFYDQRKELIYKIKIKVKNEKFSVWCMYIQGDYIIIGTNVGLWRGSIKSFDIEEIEKSFYKIDKYCRQNVPNIIIRSLIPSKSGGIWVSADNLISKISFLPDQSDPIILDELPLVGYKGVIDMKEDSKGCIWVAINNKAIIKYNPQKKSFKDLTMENIFLKGFSKKYSNIAIDHNQRVWIGTYDKGLICINYDCANDKINHIESIENNPINESGLNSNLIFSTYISSTNKLWVGTIGSGVNILDPESKKINHYSIKSKDNEIFNSNFIRAVMVDKQNRILVGTYSNGLYSFDRETKQSKKLGFETESVYHIFEYRDNLYFVCTSKGFYLVEYNGDVFRILSDSGEYILPAFYISHSRNDIYWCATLKGIFRFRVINNKLVLDPRIDKYTQLKLSANNCRALLYDDSNNQLYVGTEGGGLNCIQLDEQCNPIDNKVYEMSEDTNSISNNYVRSIYRDKNKNIWVGTYEGLNKVIHNTETGECAFKAYTKKDGLPNNMIQFIVEDDNNYLWLGTNSGLSKFSPKKESFMNYNMDDGLQSNEFSEHTVYKTQSGEFVMGGINGINSFYPNDFKESKINPKTLITNFYIDNQPVKSDQVIGRNVPLTNSILYTNKIELSPENKNIGFKFSAMIYPNSGKVKYAYMLDGFDKDWKYTDALNRNIHYTNLRHGKYIFKVKATNTDGVWDDKTTTLSIRIKTPFYLTIYAFILYISYFIMMFIYFSHYTVINLTTKRNLLLDKEHSEKIIKLDEMRTRFFINISHDLRTPLTLISGPLSEILTDKSISGKLNENLLLIKRNVKRLTDLVEQLLDFRKAEASSLTPKLETIDFIPFSNNEISYFLYAAKTKGLELLVESAEEKILIAIDPKMIAKVYFNILSNAIKFTTAGTIKINIQRVYKEIPGLLNSNSNNRFIEVAISDTGIGITKEQEKLIFERFNQGNQQRGSGYGIGLSHTKDLIESHQGMVEAESNPQGGTIIRFFIPDKVVENIATINGVYCVDEIDDNVDVISEQVNEEYSNSSFKNLLIVEDNFDILNYLKNGLKNSYNVLTANNGAEGLKVASDKMPDLIVSDVMMPEMDGIEFCKAIKTNIVTSHIPLILLTAKVDLETKCKGIETGADDYISKPFEMEYLLIRIKNLLRSRENLRQIFQRSLVLEPSEITVTSVDEKFLKKLMESIEENISDEEFTIYSLESQLRLSHSTLYRKVKSLTGQSAEELLLNIRLKRAHQILSEKKGLRISEVAFMVGISNLSYFTKCFKEYFGFPPSELKSR